MVISADQQLPTLPEVHLRALEACRRDDSYRSISDIINSDTALTGRVLSLANSAAFQRIEPAQSIEQALLRLGTDRLHTFVLTAALQQLLFEMGKGHWQQLQGFWRQSLGAALMAKALARLTRYQALDLAFLTGMLHNAGALLKLDQQLQGQVPDDHDTVPELSARLAEAWALGPEVAEALRYQDTDETLRDHTHSSHLTRLIAVAARLMISESAGLTLAARAFRLNEELTAEILVRIRNETAQLAESLGIAAAAVYDGEASTRALTVRAVRDLLASRSDPAPMGPDLLELRRQVHEISNPLTVVRQYIFQLRNRLEDPQSQDHLDIVNDELERATTLLAQLARTPETQAECRVGAELNEEIEAVCRILENGLFRQTGTRLTLALSEQLPDLQTPAAPLRQILLNLLRNGAECQSQPVEITVTTVFPVWQQDREWVELTIADNGPGLPARVQQSLFEPVQSGKGPGHSGLGLSIVKQLIDDMEGIISCQSSTAGTRFRILLPVAISSL
ncbi:HDOD domain-containing protein [uncultured Marinobacter sp.]|mgnify:CR=1 FL=1|uniref:HDOD domain-containing protein n=1 Tax=uncultured Marinobacter sp. TaxID=187379 RepID=UPI0030DBE7F8